MNDPIFKYPRTQHLAGSRLQPGDEDLSQLALADLPRGLMVVEEKLDGANAALSFTSNGELRLQSRGHYLTGGPRERHFNLFKAWADAHRARFWGRLADRYIVYGEWLYAKHTIFYDRLPHYFLEFDVLDRATGKFLSTARRGELLRGLMFASVPVLWQGEARRALDDFIGASPYKSSEWRARLRAAAVDGGLDPDRISRETDPSDQMEGLYVKIETADEVIVRCKFIRASFLTSVLESGSHWLNRPITPNQLRADVDLFAAD